MIIPISKEDAAKKFCPLSIPNPHAELKCLGNDCMAWIPCRDLENRETGKGWCGMVKGGEK